MICHRVSQIIDDKGVAIVDADHPILQAAVDNELVGPDSKPTDDMNRAVSLAVPLERQISFKFPTVITPSEQAEDLRHIGEDNTEQVMTAKQAAKAYAGMQIVSCHPCRSGNKAKPQAMRRLDCNGVLIATPGS